MFRQFWNFWAAQEDSNGLKFSFLPPNKAVHSEKILMLEKIWHLGKIYVCSSLGHLIKVEEFFHLYPNILGTLEKF
jgi:hypothetical protein